MKFKNLLADARRQTREVWYLRVLERCEHNQKKFAAMEGRLPCRMQKSRARKKKEEDFRQLQSNPLYIFEEDLKVFAKEQAEQEHPWDANANVPKTTLYRRRKNCREAFINETMSNTPYIRDPLTGNILIYDIPLEEYNGRVCLLKRRNEPEKDGLPTALMLVACKNWEPLSTIWRYLIMECLYHMYCTLLETLTLMERRSSK